MRWCVALALLAAVPAACAGDEDRYEFGLSGDGLLSPARRNAYGPGLDSDATGRPFFWAPRQSPAGVPSLPDPTLRVKPDAYGLGVGADQYGRPMERRSRF
jgi:hypothetical protein